MARGSRWWLPYAQGSRRFAVLVADEDEDSIRSITIPASPSTLEIPSRMRSPSLYIIGAQGTGKTTLLHALQDALSQQYPFLQLRPITEVARKVLQKYQFTRDDIVSSPSRALELQQLILTAQFEEESKTPTAAILCDRSGVDPIAYAALYGPSHAQKMLEMSSQWHFLRDRMGSSMVILCPLHREWLVDDGIRLMAGSWSEWEDTHLAFIQVLHANDIAFEEIPTQLVDLQERVSYVMRLWSTFYDVELSGENVLN